MKTLLSLPVLLVVLLVPGARLHADAIVVFNEVMYHPATNEAVYEWIELRNLLAVDVDISDWSLTGMIEYRFPSNSIIKGGAHLVVARSPATMMGVMNATNVYGPFTNRLENDGGLLRLRNNSGRIMDELEYGTDDDWPVAPDGSGVSLAKRDPDSAGGPAENWTGSEQMGGTPGAANFLLSSQAPPETRHIAVDTGWRYDASGADLGTAWRGSAFNDGTWASRHFLTNRAIPDLFNTGLAANGAPAPDGGNDAHYVLSYTAQGTPGMSAVVTLNHSAWLANDSASKWISVANPGTVSIAGGGYGYRTTFSLAGFLPSTVQVLFSVAIDNAMTNVFLNGLPTGLAFTGFAGLSSPFALNTGFVSGVNTLEFGTENQGAGPGGFRAVVSGSGLAVNTNSPPPPGPVTYYFRKSFDFTGDPAYTALKLNAIVADGAIFYLNGVEVRRHNLPGDPIAFSTPASSNVGSLGYIGQTSISAASLVSGANVLAVEVHQAAGSPDGPMLGVELVSTPLPAPPTLLAFNEVSASTNATFWLELANYGPNSISLAGFVIVRDGPDSNDGEYVFPVGPSIAAGGFLAVSNSTMGFHPVDGDRLYLLPPARNRVLDSLVVTKGPRARFPAATGPFIRPSAPTPGGANSFAFRDEIVINEIMYDHKRLPSTNGLPPQSTDEEWVELHNKSASAVDLTGWELAGGISYRFSAGQTIPAGGYLVVAEDAEAVRLTFPGVTIVGNIGGRLSGRSDRIVLRDPSGNPADEVRYFDSGRWPDYANGGGSSLELRDPNADNSKAEAWAASDETTNGVWQTYSYRLLANIPSGNGQPTTWQDFILGLQEAGECLIDDLSVIQSPATTPLQCVTNGGFENGITGWRALGTHNRSRVVTDPENAGNKVLHLVATGPQEHMHNHIEATFVPGRAIVSGTEYQISFRARWLAGSSLLNTRLYFNRAGRTTELSYPTKNGTPGRQNSRWISNIGPTFSGFGHQPVVPQPGAAVTVSVAAQDPQGVASAQVWWSVNSGTWNNAPMTTQGAGLYTGSIPGANAGDVVQFYVRAVDGLGGAATFPARSTNSGALYKVNDGQASLALSHNVRLILTPANIDLMHNVANTSPNQQTNVMSNDLLPCTVIYDEGRAYYDCGVHLRGSQRGRYSDIRTGFHIEFQPDDLFRGVHPVMLVDRSGAGDATANRQEEIILKHMLNRAGDIPGTYGEIARVIAPRSAHTGPCQFFPRHEDVFVESAFENGGDGTQFEMELIYYPTTANAAGYKLPQPDLVIGTDLTDLGNDKEFYRYNFMLKNHRDTDDYSRFIQFCKTLSLSGAALDAASRQVMDIDQWMRAYAMVSLSSVGDMYSFGNNHNFFTYQRASDGKFLYFPWDMDFTFTRGASGALVGDQNISKVVNLPGNLRRMYAHMLDIIATSFNSSYMTYWISHYASFAPGQNYSGHLTTIGNRVPFVLGQINGQTGTNFTVNGSTFITTNNNLLTFTGTAPASAYTIRVNGVEYPVTWTTVSQWTLRVPVSAASNVLNIVAYDLNGNPLTNFSRTITNIYTGPLPDPSGAIVFNELMFNPAAPGGAFVELINNASASFDISGYQINGLDYTFPKGSIITPGQCLALAADLKAFSNYGTNAVAYAQFDGRLDPDGETLTLIKPGTNGAPDVVIDKIRYEARAPWPAGAGTNSVQLISAAQDNTRPSNWSDREDWRFLTFTGTIAGGASQGTNFLIFLFTAGDVYVDDVVLVTGTQAGVGPNLLVNGDFESPLSGPWAVLGNHGNSVVSTELSRSGSASLHVVASASGSASSAIRQYIEPFAANTVCTLSFWFKPSTNSPQLVIRTTPGSSFTTVNVTRLVPFSPGFANSVAAPLPAYDPLWLNELQADNVTGPLDNAGQRDPWIELYNSGQSPIDLSTYYLANNYDTNLTQWRFPDGSTIAPGEFKIIWADGQPAQSSGASLHAGFRLNSATGSVALVRIVDTKPQITDYLTYSALPPDRSYGDYPDGQIVERRQFFRPTPGGTNDPAPPPIQVYINEWMAQNTSGLINTNNSNRRNDWFELYNPGDAPAILDGYFLTDNLADKFQFPIPPGRVIPAHGYLFVWADGEAGLNTNAADTALHVNFNLNQDGDRIGLFAADGTQIDLVDFAAESQFANISEGRFPDAATNIYFLAQPTPLGPNSTWANRYPSLAEIPDALVLTGESLAFFASATDPDLPTQSFSFSLDNNGPAGTAVNAISGEFTWTPSAAQSPSTNAITLRVTDSGTPPLTAARTFTVVVKPGIRITGVVVQQNGSIGFSVGTIPGKTYRVEYKDNLSEQNWSVLVPNQVVNTTTLPVTDDIGANPQRFYRVVQVD